MDKLIERMIYNAEQNYLITVSPEEVKDIIYVTEEAEKWYNESQRLAKEVKMLKEAIPDRQPFPQPTDAKVRDKIENYVDCQIIHGNIDKSEFSWLYAVCEHWFSEGRVNARAFKKEAIKKEKCIVCGGDGFTSEHDPNDPHINGQCSFCPIQVQCEVCEGTGFVIKEAIPDRQPSPSGGDAIEFGEWIHEQGYEPWGVTGLWHNIANRKIIPDKIFTTEQLYQQFKETTSNKVTKGDK